MTGQHPVLGMKVTPLDKIVDVCNNSASTVFAMIESRDAVEAADEIAGVHGVDVILIGSFDLSIDLGVGGQFRSDQYRQALTKVSEACKKHNKVFGVAGVYEDAEVQDWLINTLGARYMLVHQDSSLITSGAAKAVKGVPEVKA